MLIGIRDNNVSCTLEELKNKNQISDKLPQIVIDKVVNGIRKWTGKPHVTDICIDTREAYLKYKYDYYENLNSIIRTTFGILRHSSVLKGDLSEIKVDNKWLTGSVDNIDIRPNGDINVCDFKFYSSYSVAKHFGITITKTDVIDTFGNTVKAKNGKPKKEAVTTYVPRSNMYITLQLNIYRSLLEAAILENKDLATAIEKAGGHLQDNIKAGKIFDNLAAFLFVTDGGTWMAKSRGIYKLSYYDTDIELIPKIDSIIERKSTVLSDALEHEKLPPMCKDVYCMGESRYKCEAFCPVRDICKSMGGSTEKLF